MNIPVILVFRTLGMALAIAVFVSLRIPVAEAAAKSGEIEIKVIDQQTREPIACRLHLKNSRGVPRSVPKQPFLKDHFAFDGTVMMTLREGNYTFEAECGPEYHTRAGHFSVNRFGNDRKTIEMKRIVNMAEEGWWSGDLHVHRRPADVELLMRADDLHVAQVVTWTNKKDDLAKTSVKPKTFLQFDTNRCYRLLAGRDARAAGGLSVFGLDGPLPGLLGDAIVTDEYPPAWKLLSAVPDGDVWVEADSPTCWDLPAWVAHGLVDSIRLAGHRFGRDSHVETETGQRPRDKSIYSDANGLGRWSERVYYHLLNCGLRIPPSAGSGSGDVNNPVGYNRVYVYCGTDFTYENWWKGLRAGRVVITNGPLLRPTVEGRPPGHIFRGEPGKTLRLQAQLQLATKDKIEYLEVVKDGDVLHVVRLEDYVKRQGKLPMLEFDNSGWFLIRAVTDVGKTYRFASSGPYYVEIGDQPRISRRSAEFFHTWVHQRARNLKIKDAQQQKEVLDYHREARDYWQDLIDRATVD